MPFGVVLTLSGIITCSLTCDNEYLTGRNADGTEHRGYLSVDVVAKVVTDFKDRTGRSVVPRIRPFNPQSAANELMGRPNSYCL